MSTAIDTLLHFSRLASEASTGRDVLPALAQAALRHLRADGVIVVEVTDQGTLQVVPTPGVPEFVASWASHDREIGSDLGPALVTASGGQFARASTFPLVSTGGLFGALVLLYQADTPTITEREFELARGLADLAGITLGRAAQMAKMAQTNAELRASREVLARSEKLRALGQMAAGVSHDLRNILNPLSMHAQLAQRAIARGNAAGAVESLEECKAILRRGVEMLDRLRAFSRQSPETRAARIDLDALVREAVAIARPRASSRVGALCQFVEEHGAAPPVVARGEEVVAAIVNLVVNAIDAVDGGGTVRITTGGEGGGAFVRVADTGPGIPPALQARVFEPFFTTKGADGTGLGLAMVFATMQRCGGTVTLDTSPGQGATFTLHFPPSDPGDAGPRSG